MLRFLVWENKPRQLQATPILGNKIKRYVFKNYTHIDSSALEVHIDLVYVSGAGEDSDYGSQMLFREAKIHSERSWEDHEDSSGSFLPSFSFQQTRPKFGTAESQQKSNLLSPTRLGGNCHLCSQ